jgi:hypothetical protein
MNNQHEPSPDYVSRLEWQLLSELRRGRSFGEILPKRGPNGRFRFVLTVFLCFALGVVATMAAQYLHKTPRQQYLVAKAESDLEVAEERVEATAGILEWLESDEARKHPLYSDEAQLKREIKIARERLEDEELQLRSRQLEWEEISLTHQVPEKGLWAPLIEGRDFVSERLKIRLEVRKRELAKLRGNVAKVREYGHEPDMKTQNVATIWREKDIQKVERSLKLRQSYLNDEITKSELVEAAELADNRDQLAQLAPLLESHRDRIQELQSGFEDGLVSPLTVSEAEMRLKQMEAFERLLQLEIQLLEGDLKPAKDR